MGSRGGNKGPGGTGSLNLDDVSDHQKAAAVHGKQTCAGMRDRQAARRDEGGRNPWVRVKDEVGHPNKNRRLSVTMSEGESKPKRKNLLQDENIKIAEAETRASARRLKAESEERGPRNKMNLLGGGGTSLLGYD